MTEPQRGSSVEMWLRRCRDQYERNTEGWCALDDVLEDYGFRAESGTELTAVVGGPAGDTLMTATINPDDYKDAAAMLAIVAACDCLLAYKPHEAREILAQLDDTVFERVAEIARELRWVAMDVQSASLPATGGPG